MRKRPSRKPPHSSREVARAIIESNRIMRRLKGKPEIMWLPDWIKVELYNLFMRVLPLFITVLIWLTIFASIYWWLFT